MRIVATQAKGYKYRIYPTEEQKHRIDCTLGCSRHVYNHFLDLRINEWKANRKSLHYKDTSRLLTDYKRREGRAWLNDVDSMALQESLRDLDAAYKNFFEGRARYPKFKSKHRSEQSYRTRNQGGGIRIEGNRIRLPKLGFVKAKLSRSFEGKIKHATVRRTASGKYYISLCVEEEKPVLENGGGVLGIDVGLKEFCVTSEGEHIANPHCMKKMANRLARAQRHLARTMPKSRNHEKARIAAARIHERVKARRGDFLHKLTTRLARENKTVAVEHLNIKGMLKNHKLAAAISDVGWGEFFRQLGYKMPLYGGELLKVPTFFPSSQTCSACGYRNREVKDLSVREWDCPECGAHHDRDENAALNILDKALTMKKQETA